MTRQNRVLPTSEIVAIAQRGLFMGNRGILHDSDGHLGVSRWKHANWVCCVLEFKGRHRPVMAPGSYTELFFFDEAVALAAGHRPCAECRRSDYKRFRAAWAAELGDVNAAADMDRALHRERVRRNRAQLRYRTRAADLPEAAFFLWDRTPHVVTGGGWRPFAPEGYGPVRNAAPDALVTVLTPRSTVLALHAGYRPVLHPSAAV